MKILKNQSVWFWMQLRCLIRVICAKIKMQKVLPICQCQRDFVVICSTRRCVLTQQSSTWNLLIRLSQIKIYWCAEFWSISWRLDFLAMAAYCYTRSSMVCLSCLSVTSNPVLHGVEIPHGKVLVWCCHLSIISNRNTPFTYCVPHLLVSHFSTHEFLVTFGSTYSHSSFAIVTFSASCVEVVCFFLRYLGAADCWLTGGHWACTRPAPVK